MIYSVAFCNHLASFSNPFSYIIGNPAMTSLVHLFRHLFRQHWILNRPQKIKIKTTLLTCIIYDQYKNMLLEVSPDDELPTKVYCTYK